MFALPDPPQQLFTVQTFQRFLQFSKANFFLELFYKLFFWVKEIPRIQMVWATYIKCLSSENVILLKWSQQHLHKIVLFILKNMYIKFFFVENIISNIKCFINFQPFHITVVNFS